MTSNKYLFLVDFDNTLINNDELKEKLFDSIKTVLGEEEALKFWNHHSGFENHQMYVDYPIIVREYCSVEYPDSYNLKVTSIFDNMDISACVNRNAKETLKYLSSLGVVLIFTGGDVEFQKKKVEKSSLDKFVDGVRVFPFKMEHFVNTINEYPNKQVIYIDDNPYNLDMAKKTITGITTIWVMQGHYCRENPNYANSDLCIPNIGKLLEIKSFEIR
ncbi:MAG: HAD family hydrolase [Patescibacteria group bacterium]